MINEQKVPQIRFAGFTGDWEQRELGSVSEKVTKKNQDMVCDEVFTNSAEYGIISQRDFFDKDIANSENIDGYYIVEPNDFVYNPRISNLAPFGPIRRNKLEKSGAMSPLYYVFRTHGVDYGFLEYYFKTNGWHSFMHLNGNSGARSDRFAIRDDVFREMPITMPQNEVEQQAIGNYFTNLDHLITLHQRKCDTLRKLKQSMLQKMFPKEGEKVPEIRFAGFTDAWEQRKAKELCSISTGKSNTQDKIEDGIYPFYVRSPIVERSNRYLFDEEAVLTVGDGVGTGKVFHYVNGKYDLHQRVYRMFDFSEDITAKYFYYYFSNHFYDRVMAMTAKTSVDSVRYEMIADMDIAFPKIGEQIVISDYFDNLDHLITLHQRKLETAKKLKKAMLQKMFL